MRIYRQMKEMILSSAFLAAIFFMLVLPANAAELIMLERAGCVWCERWHTEIGPIYSKTREGKVAPLREVDIEKDIPDDLAGIRIDRLTPTFILVDNGVEIDRFRGYPGDDFFWFLLDEMLKKLPKSS